VSRVQFNILGELADGEYLLGSDSPVISKPCNSVVWLSRWLGVGVAFPSQTDITGRRVSPIVDKIVKIAIAIRGPGERDCTAKVTVNSTEIIVCGADRWSTA
jgi:hypothetical protein